MIYHSYLSKLSMMYNMHAGKSSLSNTNSERSEGLVEMAHDGSLISVQI